MMLTSPPKRTSQKSNPSGDSLRRAGAILIGPKTAAVRKHNPETSKKLPLTSRHRQFLHTPPVNQGLGSPVIEP